MNVEMQTHEDPKYLPWLAESLVSSLGYERAVAACRRMAWYQVLSYLLSAEGKGLRAPAGQRLAPVQ